MPENRVGTRVASSVGRTNQSKDESVQFEKIIVVPEFRVGKRVGSSVGRTNQSEEKVSDLIEYHRP